MRWTELWTVDLSGLGLLVGTSLLYLRGAGQRRPVGGARPGPPAPIWQVPGLPVSR